MSRTFLAPLIFFVLAGCKPAAQLRCIGAERDQLASTEQLRLSLSASWSSEVLEALDASVPLQFNVMLDQGQRWQRETVQLKFEPLLERYELQHGERRQVYRLRAELLEAFANTLRFGNTPLIERLRIELDRGALPAPMRMPALLNSNWTLDSGWCNLQFQQPAAVIP